MDHGDRSSYVRAVRPLLVPDLDPPTVKLTRIEYRARSERVRLYFDDDDSHRLEIATDLLLQAGLAAGDEIGEARLRDIELQDETYRGREAALSLLAHRARSRTEIRRRLWKKDFADAVIDDVLAWLDDRGYVDDAEFARTFVRDRLRLRPKGRLGLIQELRKKGVADDVAEGAIESVLAAEQTSEVALAAAAAEAWARKNRSALRKAAASTDDRQKARRRLYGHLARRGFSGDAVRRAMDDVLGD